MHIDRVAKSRDLGYAASHRLVVGRPHSTKSKEYWKRKTRQAVDRLGACFHKFIDYCDLLEQYLLAEFVI